MWTLREKRNILINCSAGKSKNLIHNLVILYKEITWIIASTIESGPVKEFSIVNSSAFRN
jgi:hypothetical protein